MSSTRAEQDGARPREVAAAHGSGAPAFAPAAAERSPVSPSTVRAVAALPLAGGGPEEVALCDFCGLVSRRPAPPVCPACGGGYG